MNLIIEEKAQDWFLEEVGIPEGAGIRFKIRIYGSSPVNDTFALAIEPTYPHNAVTRFEGKNGLLYFIEQDDEWFFQGHDLIVSYDEELQEPIYIYRKDGVDKV